MDWDVFSASLQVQILVISPVFFHLEEGFPTFAVCTCPSCMDVFPRMPLIFGNDMVHSWLSPDTAPESLFRHRFMSLVTDYEASWE